MAAVILPPSDCFQISLSLDKNLMSFIRNESTQLYIMNDLLTTCLGTLSFQLSSQKAPQSSSSSLQGASHEASDIYHSVNNTSTPKPHKERKRTKGKHQVPTPAFNQKLKEETAERDEEDEIVCVKEEPSAIRNRNCSFPSNNPGNPYESSEIIPGLFTQVKAESNHAAVTPKNKKQRGPASGHHELDLRPVGGFDDSGFRDEELDAFHSFAWEDGSGWCTEPLEILMI